MEEELNWDEIIKNEKDRNDARGWLEEDDEEKIDKKDKNNGY